MSDLAPGDETQDESQDEAQKAAEQLRVSLIALTQHYEMLATLEDASGAQVPKDKAEALGALMAELGKVGIQFREGHGLPNYYSVYDDDDEGA